MHGMPFADGKYLHNTGNMAVKKERGQQDEVGYADGGELLREEYEVGLALANAIANGQKESLDATEMLVLERFVMGVNAHPSRKPILSRAALTHVIKRLGK